jgi:acetyl esterase/lipase
MPETAKHFHASQPTFPLSGAIKATGEGSRFITGNGCIRIAIWLGCLGLVSAPGLRAQTLELLWPQGAPGALGQGDGDKPAVLLYLAANAKANGAAVVICPGGAYGFLSMDNEGSSVAKWMNTRGVSAFVLRYRLGPRYHHPIEMHDAQRAMRWVRANANRFKIDPKRVGIIGFSAGGHLASTVATHYDSGAPGAADSVDRFSCRPAFHILGYPVITMDAGFTHQGSRTNLLGDNPSPDVVNLLSNEKQVDAKTSPGFLFHAKDDGVVKIKNSQLYYEALIKSGVPAKFKVFEKGGHGFGLATGQGGAPTDTVLATWAPLAANWLDSLGYFKTTVTVMRASVRPARFGEKETGYIPVDVSGRFYPGAIRRKSR